MNGERLRELRKEEGITQIELAEILDKTNGAISAYETGRKNPSLEVLGELADLFGVSTDYLMGREEAKNEQITGE